MGGFCHLHTHSTYSLLDGAAKIDALFAEAGRLEMPALAITDHGNMFGAAEFYRASLKSTVKPILGIEAYVAPTSRHLKQPVYWGRSSQRGDDVSGSGAYCHMTMLARNATGLRNLFKLSSLASIEGFYQKPRMDRELITQHSAGIIATTGCSSGEVQTRLRLSQPKEALQASADYRDIFGVENFYLELMDHGLSIERDVREALLDIGRQLNLKPLATNDSHYVTRGQSAAHDALLCVQTGKKLTDKDRFRFEGSGYYLRSAAEMRACWDAEVPGACDNTLRVAEQVESYAEVFAAADRKPRVRLEPGDTEDAALRREVAIGTTRLFPSGTPTAYRERLDTELDVISRMGFPGYFLVTADLVRWARSEGYFCRARGSAAGSLVAYALGITDIDPVAHDLYFERFINPDRVSPPDIDIDIEDRHRAKLAAYLTDAYGADKTAQVVAFGTIKTRAAITDATRVLDYPISLGEKIKKALPRPVHAEDIPLSGVFDPDYDRYAEAAAVRELADSDMRCAEILDIAAGIEGLIRNTGVHACGVFLSSEPLIDVIPLWMRQDDGAIVTGWGWSACEDVGLLKMDLLGSATLRAIADTLNAVKATHGVVIELTALPLDDQRTYDLLSSGATLGVFQFEESGARETLCRVTPTCFDDICAATALYRPGPMEMGAHHEYADRKNGRRPTTPIHPELAEPLAEILDDTYGLIVYQEQIMAIGRKVAGYTLGQADILRRAMGKKSRKVLDSEYTRFHDGMAANGFSTAATKALWDTMLPFTSYAFNRLHSASYGLQSYWTAYLKAHYPVEFMAGRLSSVSSDKTRTGIYLAECRRMGIKVLPPDVNTSGQHFVAIGGAIRFGMPAIRNVGEGAAQAVADGRGNGSYTSFADFLDRVDLKRVTKRTVDALARAGAFDSLGCSRRAIVEGHSAAVDAALSRKRDAGLGQGSLFDDEPENAPELALDGPEWPPEERLAHEREQLGLYVSAHPLDGVERTLRRHTPHSIGELLLERPAESELVTVAGMVAFVEVKRSRQGKPWATAVIEDTEGQLEVRFLGRVYAEIADRLKQGAIVAISGRVADGEGELRILGERLTVIDVNATAEPPPTGPIVLPLAVEDCSRARISVLRTLLDRHRGEDELRIRFIGKRGARSLVASACPVASSSALLAELREFLWNTAAYASLDQWNESP